MAYTPSNWYWVVSGNSTLVWSSARLDYVPTTDSTYATWRAAGNRATNIGSATDLIGVIQQQVVPNLLTGGVVIVSTGTPELDATYAIDSASQANLTALSTGIAAGKPLPGGGETFNYPDITGTMHAFSAANFLNFAAEIEGYFYNFNQALPVLISGGSTSLPSNSLTIA